MLKFNHNDLSGWSMLRLDPDDHGYSTYDLLQAMKSEANIIKFHETDLLYDAFLLANANERDEYAWMPRIMGTQLYRLVDESDDDCVNHALEIYGDNCKLFILHKCDRDHWIMYRLKPATENPGKTLRHDRQLDFQADLYKARQDMNYYKANPLPLTDENKADLETIRTAINDLLAGKEAAADA